MAFRLCHIAKYQKICDFRNSLSYIMHMIVWKNENKFSLKCITCFHYCPPPFLTMFFLQIPKNESFLGAIWSKSRLRVHRHLASPPAPRRTGEERGSNLFNSTGEKKYWNTYICSILPFQFFLHFSDNHVHNIMIMDESSKKFARFVHYIPSRTRMLL